MARKVLSHKKNPQKIIDPKGPATDIKTRLGQNLTVGSIRTSPSIFTDDPVNPMASALPIWEASNILTQRTDLPWVDDPNGKLRYAKDIGNGAIHFWVTENIDDETPVTLAGAAALAVVDTFDIRAACMHLIYAAHATQLDHPWEQELIIDDRQIESYLGLQRRTDKNRQEKLALIEEIAIQPCKITTFISCPTQGKIKGFTIEEGRLWHILGTRYQYQQNLLGEKELIGITFIVKPGLWARYFLNEEGWKDKVAYFQRTSLSKGLLGSVMNVWQHREGAARLMMWLVFKTQIDEGAWIQVQTLMEVAYGSDKVEKAKSNSPLRKKLTKSWDDDLLALQDRGWAIDFDPQSYPPKMQPSRNCEYVERKPLGYFKELLVAYVHVSLRKVIVTNEVKLEENLPEKPKLSDMTSDRLRSLRVEKGWSQRKLASLSGISQGLISLIENGERTISWENGEILEKILAPST